MPDVNLFLAVLVLAVGTYATRLGGVGFGGSRLARQFEQWTEPAVIVLLAGVATTGALYDGQEFAGWARVAGVAVTALAAAIRAPFVVVVLVAAAITAGLRAVGVH
ncbi:branched-subunit amino acid transport protein AzlD [Glaciihabitans tibetensis]|uniref:Branched-subunit amino acid transport protein AzlD n=1 Tax=Glaciihabitans tibetensis TaxID=1266600 RepID=A0A2T0VCH8_9MICO|nr:AzlD domain-containing protein [Glaciihabitans tibetensis]PRY67883.1 branched-subunit amino acid transport protein AzlD [Glaciihabitans tibetensis]